MPEERKGSGAVKTGSTKRGVPVGESRETVASPIGVSQTGAAVEKIRSRIIDLTIPPGSRIDEPLLLKEFQLGRTPAREAIHQLAAEGFVRILPNRGGTFVRKLDLAEIGEITVAHQLAENILAQLCRLDDATLADDLERIQALYRVEVGNRNYLNITALNEQFHMRMNQSIGNSFFHDFALSTHRHVRRLLVYLYTLESAQPEQHDEQFELNVQQHDSIIEAVREEDRAKLAGVLPEHARATQDRLIQILQSNTVDPFPVELRLLTLPENPGI
jgi:DNA-binding GntR family transcriptional regulator